MINKVFHNADGTPKSGREVLSITSSKKRMELISMLMQATNPVHFLKRYFSFYCIWKPFLLPAPLTQITDSIMLVFINYIQQCRPPEIWFSYPSIIGFCVRVCVRQRGAWGTIQRDNDRLYHLGRYKWSEQDVVKNLRVLNWHRMRCKHCYHPFCMSCIWRQDFFRFCILRLVHQINLKLSLSPSELWCNQCFHFTWTPIKATLDQSIFLPSF